MKESWIEAAKSYERCTIPARRGALNYPPPIVPSKTVATTKDIPLVARELDAFFRSDDGLAAEILLAASESTIDCALYGPDEGWGELYIITADGFSGIYHRMGLGLLYASKPPVIRVLTAEQLVEAVYYWRKWDNLSVLDFLPWLFRELDIIALRAPTPRVP